MIIFISSMNCQLYFSINSQNRKAIIVFLDLGDFLFVILDVLSKCMDTLPCLSAISILIKGNNFCDFQVDSLDDEAMVAQWVKHWLMDGWMTCDFTSFSTAFQSYQDHGRLIMKCCVQWNSVYG